jgi:hypothetical protein
LTPRFRGGFRLPKLPGFDAADLRAFWIWVSGVAPHFSRRQKPVVGLVFSHAQNQASETGRSITDASPIRPGSR